MNRPRLLDLFCGAGGAAMGYHRAGFDVVGVDIRPQPNYPFEFHHAEATDVLESIRDGGHWFYEIGDPDVFHASPPCQAYSGTQKLHGREHPRLIEATRLLLNQFPELPYVIENVVGAPLCDPVLLCGSMFGLEVKRHRLFECGGFDIPLRPACAHGVWAHRYPTHARKDKAQTSPVVHVYGTGGGAGKDLELWKRVMGVPWMASKAEVAEAIPPAYTELIGHQLMAHIRVAA